MTLSKVDARQIDGLEEVVGDLVTSLTNGFVNKAAVAATIIGDDVHSIELQSAVTLGDAAGGLYIDTNNGSNDTVVSLDGRTWYAARDVGTKRLTQNANDLADLAYSLGVQPRVPKLAEGKIIARGQSVNLNTGAYTSADSANFQHCMDLIAITPASRRSFLHLNITLNIQIASAADAFATAELVLVYTPDGTNWTDVGTSEFNFGGQSGAVSTNLSLWASPSFNTQANWSQLRSDNGAWGYRVRAKAGSGGTWTTRTAKIAWIEFEPPPTSTALATVRTFEHYACLGQSLGQGTTALPVLTTTAVRAGRAFSFDPGPRLLVDGGSTLAGEELYRNFVDLLEVAGSGVGETPCSEAARFMTEASGLPASSGVVWSNHAAGGQSYTQIKKGTLPFDNFIGAMARSRYIADQTGRTYRVPAAINVHGEADRAAASGVYKGFMVEFQTDIQAAAHTYDGLGGTVPLFLCQMVNWTAYSQATSFVPLDQLNAMLENPGKIYCIGPKYQLATHTDGIHLTNTSTRRWGAYYGRALKKWRLGEEVFPLYALSAVRSGNVIDVAYRVPVGPLVLDTSLVTNPGNFGFRYVDDTSSASISSVVLLDASTVRITLNTVPTGANPYIGIADIGTSGNFGGPTTGPRCCLRDSATDVAVDGFVMRNYACVQRINVTV